MKTKKKPEQVQFEQVKDKFQTAIQQMNELLLLMPTKGNSIEDCQKTNIQYHLNSLENCINGVEVEDFEPNEYSGDFKFSYS